MLFVQPLPSATRIRHIGFECYKYIVDSATIILSENMRTTNADYILLQNRIRVGQWDKDIDDKIRLRCNATLPTLPETLDQHIPVIVCFNKTRQKLESLKANAVSHACIEQGVQLPIMVTAHMAAKGIASPLSMREREFIAELPDSCTDKIAMVLILYPGAQMAINSNVNLSCSLAQGGLCTVIGWPTFPPNTTFQEAVYKGARVRFAVSSKLERIQPELIYVKMKFPMRAVPAGQPAGLGTDELALPMLTLVANISLDGLKERGQNRASVTCKIEQLPLRPANAVTTYACIGSEFNRYIILETNVAQFYTQISRGKFGLENVSIAATLRKGFCASPRDGVAEEMENLKVKHDKTLRLFS